MIRVLYNTIESSGADETTKVRGKCSAARMKVRIEEIGGRNEINIVHEH